LFCWWSVIELSALRLIKHVCANSKTHRIYRLNHSSNFDLPLLKRLVPGFLSCWRVFELGSDHVGFVVEKLAMEPVFSEYFSFPYQFLFYKLLHIH
jgi:hypothetical protein